MIPETPTIQYPLYFNCGSLANFEAKEMQCRELLDLPNATNGTYGWASPLTDVNGDNWIIVYENVLSLFDESKLKKYDEIQLPKIERI